MIQIWVDGSTVTNPGPGAWAAVIVANGRERTITGYDPATTNSRMELEAAVEGLRFFKGRQEVTVYSDSQYVVNMVAKGWIDKWAVNNFRKRVSRTGKYEDVKNQDLVIRLANQNLVHDVTWEWIRGHDGHHYNELAHMAAYNAAQEGYARDLAMKTGLGPQASISPTPTETAQELTEGGRQGVDTPRGNEGYSESPVDLAEGVGWIDLPELKPIPDPPESEWPETWCVRERKSTYVLGRVDVYPMSPNEYEDGARSYCIRAARKMNKSHDPIVLPFAGRGRWVALPHDVGEMGRVLSKEEDREIMEYMKEGKVVDLATRR